MKSTRLSIVTVVRNSLSLLEKTIASLNLQSEKSYEYVIIDGASSDATREFVLRNPKPASIVLSEPDGGIYSAMNKAPTLCSGDYIQYLNAGDTLFDTDTVIAIYCLSILAGAVSFIPGGLGATEAAIVLLLSAAGVGQSDAITASLVSRSLTLWLAVGVGAFSMLKVAAIRPQTRN